jgi:hypothetical protein
MLWKEMFAESAAGRMGWIGRIVIGLLIAAITIPLLGTFYECWPNKPEQFIGTATVMGDFVGCFGLLIVAARAATLVTSEKERDSWVSLLSTPLTAESILQGKLGGNLYAARWIGSLLALIWLLPVLMNVRFWGVATLVMATWILLACYASCLGLAFSLALRNSTRAMAAALATLVFFGGIYLMFAMPIFAILTLSGHHEPWVLMSLCIPFLQIYPVLVWDSNPWYQNGSMLLAYLAGMFIYAIVSYVLWNRGLVTFDERAGRMREQ